VQQRQAPAIGAGVGAAILDAIDELPAVEDLEFPFSVKR